MSSRRNVVAVVDDTPGTLRAMKHLLSAYGYETELYSSAKAFLDSVAASEASCYLIDVHLGEGSGIELARQLVQAGFKLPTIFMTGSDDEVIESRATEAGCVALLRKPIFAEALIAALIKAAP
jgi:FixJ family two-component response regulator